MTPQEHTHTLHTLELLLGKLREHKKVELLLLREIGDALAGPALPPDEKRAIISEVMESESAGWAAARAAVESMAAEPPSGRLRSRDSKPLNPSRNCARD